MYQRLVNLSLSLSLPRPPPSPSLLPLSSLSPLSLSHLILEWTPRRCDDLLRMGRPIKPFFFFFTLGPLKIAFCSMFPLSLNSYLYYRIVLYHSSYYIEALARQHQYTNFHCLNNVSSFQRCPLCGVSTVCLRLLILCI